MVEPSEALEWLWHPQSYFFPIQVSHSTPKKEEEKISLLLTQVTTQHSQKNFSGTPNMNCLVLSLATLELYQSHVKAKP
jgi:hypothetical protein